MAKTVTVATHNGVFHADDCFTAALLRIIYTTVEIFRTRDPDKINAAEIVFDVGGVYDPATDRFDHHQRGGAGTRENGVPYSSFGLSWRRYGAEACGGDPEAARLVDEALVQSVDAADCSFALSEAKVAGTRSYSVSAAMSSLNPGWNEDIDFDHAFVVAMGMAEMFLQREIARAKGTIAARTAVREAVAASVATGDPRVVVFDRFLPWQDEICQSSDSALFVVFPSGTGDWRIQCVPDKPGSFGKRKPLPASWGGKRADELAELTGVPDAIFTHIGLFIGGAKSFEGVMAMAKLALV